MSHTSQDQESGKAILEIVRQATAALATMDAGRLEELAQCCADLNRMPSAVSSAVSWVGSDATDPGMAGRLDVDLRVLGQVLAETQSNLSLLERLHAARIGSTGREAALPEIANGRGHRGREISLWEPSMQP